MPLQAPTQTGIIQMKNLHDAAVIPFMIEQFQHSRSHSMPECAMMVIDRSSRTELACFRVDPDHLISHALGPTSREVDRAYQMHTTFPTLHTEAQVLHMSRGDHVETTLFVGV